ncbi:MULTISPECIES: hypothetical protein [Enterococcus]|uniref:hypothetical protein n=1 Tax=Enterococcus TaxID=1350 RepID=UPI000DEBEFA8|nr:hypothetical protein [Enterococcus faecalis]EGO8125664.1 hypothetical protein [Enterococcus faecalis]EKG8798457.1 hypothetical protein [Enterococcus faecalis]EKJ3567721.1 hypothetical protein [Enterococcus faecalis]ELS1302846.1 hypothetical protein [Enterococcus faecalis]ELU8995644.1 hypothetical protein [Enterococcus faecalis]
MRINVNQFNKIIKEKEGISFLAYQIPLHTKTLYVTRTFDGNISILFSELCSMLNGIEYRVKHDDFEEAIKLIDEATNFINKYDEFDTYQKQELKKDNEAFVPSDILEMLQELEEKIIEFLKLK